MSTGTVPPVRRARIGWLAALPAVLTLVSCSGDGGGGDVPEAVAVSDWAAAVCAEVGEAAVDLRAALAVIDELPAEVEADAALGDQAGPVRDAFLALPAYVERYRAVVEGTGPPDIADGEAFRQEVLDDLAEAEATFGEAAAAAESLDASTTVEGFFAGSQAFGDFPAAFDASDLDFGEDAPPAVTEVLTSDPACVEVQNQLLDLIA